MDRQSYEDGRTGQSSGPNTNADAYRAGQREADAGTYKAGWEGESSNSRSGGGGGTVSYGGGGGSVLGLVFLAPVMFMTYPAGAILTLSILGVAGKLLEAFHVPVPAMIFICIALAFPAVFAGLWLEKKVSMNGAYRVLRLIWRTVVCGMAIFAGSLISSLGIAKQRINLDMIMNNLDQSAGALVWTVILMIGVFWLLRKADRIYFPPTGVWEQDPDADVQVKTIAKPRSTIQRVLMSVVWFVPAALVTHLIIRLLVDAYFGSTLSDPDAENLRLAFYDKNLTFIIIADVMIWLLLSIKGVLPGTAKHRKN